MRDAPDAARVDGASAGRWTVRVAAGFEEMWREIVPVGRAAGSGGYFRQPFGAAASLAILLVWIYYASLILLLGAEFTETWANERGRGVRPERGAVRVVEEEREIR